MQQRFLLQILPLLHLVGILFPHINDDARSKSQQYNTIQYYYNIIQCNINFPRRETS